MESTKLYLDTSVLMGKWLSESKRFIYIPERFDELMQCVRQCDYSFVLSTTHRKEVAKKYSFLVEKFDGLVVELEAINKVAVVSKTDEDVKNALKLLKKHVGLHFTDALHLQMAKRHADIFVTDDNALYEAAFSEMKTKLLEELV